jgi:arylformamidase
VRLYDVSWPLSPATPVWPGDAPIALERVRDMRDGARNNLSNLACSVHVGTHVDAPLHFVADGADVTALSLDVLIGPARVIELPDAAAITVAALGECDLSGVTRLLLKTRNSRLSRDVFHTSFAAIELDAAGWLVERGIKLVGVDYLSVERFGGDGSVHRALLGAGMVLIEGMELADVPPGDYALYCLPLRLVGSEGAPARVVLVQESA